MPEIRKELAVSHNSLGLVLEDLGQWPAAEQAYRRALDIQEKLVAEVPNVSEYRLDLAGTRVNFGHLLTKQGQGQNSLVWFAKAIAMLEPMVKGDPRLVVERQFLRNAHLRRAEALAQLGRHADAVKEWDRVLEINAETHLQSFIRLQRALSLARAGEHAKAVAEANSLVEAQDVTAAMHYNLACVCALASAAVKDDVKLHHQYAARAVEILRQAVAKGYKEAAHMRQDRDLDALRERDDFKKLLAELDAASSSGKP
jgi:tetratricopeptide (TPR) repeat protein